MCPIRKRVPALVSVPVVVIGRVILLCGIAEIAALMQQTMISPILKLVHTSQKIAANDFFIEDVQVENRRTS